MALPSGIQIQLATNGQELPASIAKQLGPMYLKRYNPSPVPPALKNFKSGASRGVLVWALREDGKVVGWALRAVPPNKQSLVEVITFVRAANRRQGIGDAMLDLALQRGPKGQTLVYPHDPAAKAFYDYRHHKLGGASARAAKGPKSEGTASGRRGKKKPRRKAKKKTGAGHGLSYPTQRSF